MNTDSAGRPYWVSKEGECLLGRIAARERDELVEGQHFYCDIGEKVDD